MTPAQTHARALIPTAGTPMQAALAAALEEYADEWIAAEGLLIEMSGAVDERYAQVNDARRHEVLVAAE